MFRGIKWLHTLLVSAILFSPMVSMGSVVSVAAPSALLAASTASVHALILDWMPNSILERVGLDFHLPADLYEFDVEDPAESAAIDEAPVPSSAASTAANVVHIASNWRELLGSVKQSTVLIWQKGSQSTQYLMHDIAHAAVNTVAKASEAASAVANIAQQKTQHMMAVSVASANRLIAQLPEQAVLAQGVDDLHHLMLEVGQSAERAYDRLAFEMKHQFTLHIAQLQQMRIRAPVQFWALGAAGVAGLVLVGAGSLFWYRQRLKRRQNASSSEPSQAEVVVETENALENNPEQLSASATELDVEKTVQTAPPTHDVDTLSEDLSTWLEKHPAVSVPIPSAADSPKRTRRKKKGRAEERAIEDLSSETAPLDSKEAPESVSVSDIPEQEIPPKAEPETLAKTASVKAASTSKNIRRKQTDIKEKHALEPSIQEEPPVPETPKNEALPQPFEVPLTEPEAGSIEKAPKRKTEHKQAPSLNLPAEVIEETQAEVDSASSIAPPTVKQKNPLPGPLKVIRAFQSQTASSLEVDAGRLARRPSIQAAQKISIDAPASSLSVGLPAEDTSDMESLNASVSESTTEEGPTRQSADETEVLSHFKLELAKAYSELGEVESARTLLEEARRSDNETVVQAASEQLATLSVRQPKRRRTADV